MGAMSNAGMKAAVSRCPEGAVRSTSSLTQLVKLFKDGKEFKMGPSGQGPIRDTCVNVVESTWAANGERVFS